MAEVFDIEAEEIITGAIMRPSHDLFPSSYSLMEAA